jgi:uncharacterized protein (TIGR02145 family)
MKNDIFISYSRHDTNVVNEIVAMLEQEGYSVWIDRDGIESGEDFKRVILKAIKESEVVLFFSSEHSNVSDWTAKEIGVAVKYRKHTIPIKLDDSNFNEAVEFDLINLDYIDYSKATIRPAMREKLLKTLRNKLGPGSKEIERLEAERKAKEAAERLESERKAEQQRAEAKRKAEEARRKAELERLEREHAEAQRKAQLAQTDPKTPSPKPKKILWIGIGAAAALALLLVLLLKPKQAQLGYSGSAYGHDYVDLGLPSGTLWATCNVGASSPKGYGNYYAWGETSTKSTYNWDTYKYANGNYDKLTKYCNKSGYGYNGFTDNLTTLLPEDDVATANWGNGWRTPSKTQWDELLKNTTNKWTRQNGKKGRLFTSKMNGQTLFLPAAGDRSDGGLHDAGRGGFYWSSSLYTGSPYDACALYISSGDSSMYTDDRYYGQSVRAVRVGSQN